MKKFKLSKAVTFLATVAVVSLCFAMPAAVFANESFDLTAEPLDTPTNLVLNRGHIENLAFGGPIGLSWAEVDNRATFTVFAFKGDGEHDSDEAYTCVDGIDALYLDVNTAFPADLSDGPFWFRVQAVAGDLVSELSEPMGPFWYAVHSDEFADNPAGSFAIFDNAEIPVIVVDTRRPAERADQGNIVGDVHVPWPNAMAVEEGITHADFQNGVLAAWQKFIDNDLTEAQRENLNPELAYRDIRMFFY